MPFTLTMPKLSPTMEEGTIVKWRKKEGDLVNPGDVLFEVATDKATVEHSALDGGWLRKIIVNEGQEAVVNQAVAIFTEDKNESIDSYVPEGIAPKSKQVEPLLEQKEEAAKELAPSAPKPAGGAMQQPAFVPAAPIENYQFNIPTDPLEKRLKASPLARKIAMEKGLDLTTVKGSGPNRRIMSRDLSNAQSAGIVSFGRREAPRIPPGTYEEESLSPMRKIIGTRLQESKTFIPHFYVTQEILADAMSDARDQLKNIGIKISINDLIVRAAALALRQHPEINSGFNSVNSSIIRFKTVDISIAVSLPSGLITPIVRHADFKNIGQLSTEVKNLASKARDGKLQKEEYVGGSFTISNLGMFGVSEFVAVINPPQAAILAVAGIEEKPIVKNGQIQVGKTMRLTLSSDHRVIDGADAAKFIKTLKEFLENPSMLLI